MFDPKSNEPFKLSRTKIELFTQCPRCFYLDSRLGVPRPKGPPFALNSAVDTLLKKEFDIHRVKATRHPLMSVYGIDAVPFKHEKMDLWRDALRNGISTLHKPTNLFIRGGVDDVWQDKNGDLIVVDYKATSKEGKITLDDEWKIQYKRQIEIYQWLFRQNGFNVSNTGYFVYVNGKTDRKSFDGKLEFDVAVIPYVGSDGWIEDALVSIKECLMTEAIPEANPDCEYCSYVSLVNNETTIESDTKSPAKKPKIRAKTAKKGTEGNKNLF